LSGNPDSIPELEVNTSGKPNGLLEQVVYMKGSVKEPNKFHIDETEKISRKASDAAEYIELFGSFTRDRHARRI